MDTVSGGCHCGNIRLELALTRAPAEYAPRECDCEFCRKHGAAYVSDPRGSLRIRVRDAGQTSRYRQGSGQAEMLLCRNCGVLLGALYQDRSQLYAVVNANAVGAQFGVPRAVSPRSLSDSDKLRRWKDLWFADVMIEAQTHEGLAHE
ncbi:MAG TPA: hypothetical protein VEU54_07200 [Steroidobacteraceae bacterium]|nr:hypothetical protein [Steroidobacteraceae bacterium]